MCEKKTALKAVKVEKSLEFPLDIVVRQRQLIVTGLLELTPVSAVTGPGVILCII